MMVNCPKCNLLQPKDQYCARCGINMETWQPPPLPLWKKIITNWMVQLAILFAIIFMVVLRDNLRSGHPDRDTVPTSLPEQSFSLSRTQEVQQASAPPSQKQRPTSSASQNVVTTRNLEPQSPTQEMNTERRLQKKATLRVFLMSRILIEKLAQNSQRLSEASMIIPKVLLDKTLVENRRELQVIGSFSNRFELEQPAPLFVGEEDLETGLNLGFFLQVNVEIGRAHV